MTSDEYNRCVDDLSDAIFRFALKHLRNADDAKEIVQLTFEKCWMKHQDIDNSKAKSYLFSTAYHAIVDDWRKKKPTTDIDSLPTIHHPFELQPQPDFHLKQALEKALNELTPVLKTVILLRDYEGYSYTEIGDVTNLNESQVKVYIFRARKFLKDRLTPFYLNQNEA